MQHSFFYRAAALCVALAFSGAASAALPIVPKPAPMTKKAYEAAKDKIAAQYKADQKFCNSLDGHKEDVCEAEAKGKAEAARADLEADYKPSPEASQKAKYVTADANYEVAKAKCDALSGGGRKRCLKEAKAAREAAVRQAKVEKVRETGGPFGSGASADRKAGTS
jgi:hypothetical protein